MLANKVVMVTGCGSGLGRALAQAFVDEGCLVVGIAHRDENLRETQALIDSEKFLPYLADVADASQVDDVVQSVIDRASRIDILFNNAAVYPKQSFLTESAASWSRSIAVNLNGAANCCKSALPVMISNGFGRIYNLGSFADVSPIPNSAAYSSSKGAIHALTKAIAADLTDLDVDIEVHEWIPGHLNTQMSDFTGIDPSVSAGWAVQMAAQPCRRKKSCLFVNDKEWKPPKGLRRRVKDKVLFWRQNA